MSEAHTSKPMITLISAEGKQYQVTPEVARMSTVIDDFFDLGTEDDTYDQDDDLQDERNSFNCSKVSWCTLAKVVEYCTYYKTVEEMLEIDHFSYQGRDDDDSDDETGLRKVMKQEWYANFILDLDRDALKELVLAATYLHIEPLISLSVLGVTETIQGLNPKEMETFFESQCEECSM